MAQAELNIGTVGHVDHGKTTLVSSLTGTWTDTHSEEKKRGITIKLGYADVVFYKCTKCSRFGTSEKCKHCSSPAEKVKKISFIDAPGHETLMATVIAASSVMDGALFVIAANEKCPQPQTFEHLMVLEAAGIKNVVIAQNKVDLVSKEAAKKNYQEILEFLKGTSIENAPIIPTVANTGANLDALIEQLLENITPRDRKKGEPLMYVARSFDVNKPGTAIEKLVGGVLGGSIVQGEFAVGAEIEILPGATRQKKDKDVLVPLKTKIVGLNAGREQLQKASPGGLVALATSLDPALTRADALVGCLAGKPGTLPQPLSEATIKVAPLPRQLEKFPDTFTLNEPLVLGAGTATTVGFVQSSKKGKLELKLKKPICIAPGDKIAIMRRSKNRWHLYATATL